MLLEYSRTCRLTCKACGMAEHPGSWCWRSEKRARISPRRPTVNPTLIVCAAFLPLFCFHLIQFINICEPNVSYSLSFCSSLDGHTLIQVFTLVKEAESRGDIQGVQSVHSAQTVGNRYSIRRDCIWVSTLNYPVLFPCPD